MSRSVFFLDNVRNTVSVIRLNPLPLVPLPNQSVMVSSLHNYDGSVASTLISALVSVSAAARNVIL